MVPFKVIHILDVQKLYITDLFEVLLAKAVARKDSVNLIYVNLLFCLARILWRYMKVSFSLFKHL